MEKLYIALVDTPGFFADIIRHIIKISYCHVALSFDADFQEAYSVGRRDPAIAGDGECDSAGDGVCAHDAEDR